MYFDKRYLQFNDLVFDGFDMISDYDEPLQFKGSSTAYSYGHGSYMPFKNDYLYVSERQVNMTITLKLKKLPCEYREFYVRFAIQELSKPGKLWAIRGNEILWANAKVNNLRPVNNGKKDEVVFDIEFVVPGGVWHKADKQRTFLLPYNICTLMECKGFENYNSAAQSKGGNDCCSICEDNKADALRRGMCGCCCEDDVTADMALGFHLNELQKFYGCDTPYQIVYSCLKGEEFNSNEAFGQRLRLADVCTDSIMSGQIYSDTDIPTSEMTITILGDMIDPEIEINGNVNVINGEYHGRLVIETSGDVYYIQDECCGRGEPLDPSVWSVPKDNDYGWQINPGLNGVVIRLNTCCGETGVGHAYIDHTAITI